MSAAFEPANDLERALVQAQAGQLPDVQFMDKLLTSQVFVLLVPEHATDRHLQLLSELAQMFSERSFRERLAAARDPAEVHALIRDWQPAP